MGLVEAQEAQSPVRHFVIAVYAVTDKRSSQQMRRLLAVPFERTATREEVPPVVAERNLQQVRLHDVTECLPKS